MSINNIMALMGTNAKPGMLDVGNNKELLQIAPQVLIKDAYNLYCRLNPKLPIITEFSSSRSWLDVFDTIIKYFNKGFKSHRIIKMTRDACDIKIRHNFYVPLDTFSYTYEFVQYYCEKSYDVRLAVMITDCFTWLELASTIPLDIIYSIKERDPEFVDDMFKAIGWMSKNFELYCPANDPYFKEYMQGREETPELSRAIKLLNKGATMRKSSITAYFKKERKFGTVRKLQKKLYSIFNRDSFKLSKYNVDDVILDFCNAENMKLADNQHRIKFVWSCTKGGLTMHDWHGIKNSKNVYVYPFMRSVLHKPGKKTDCKPIWRNGGIAYIANRFLDANEFVNGKMVNNFINKKHGKKENRRHSRW
jgi:hypothetical protein